MIRVVVTLGLLVLLAGVEALASGQVFRTLPESFVPAEVVPVSLLITPSPGTEAYAVEEWVPATWSPRNISHRGRYDAAQGKIKWGPFLDDAIRVLSYEVISTASDSGAVAFAGYAAFAEHPPVPIQGDGVLSPPPATAFRSTAGPLVPGSILSVQIAATPGPIPRSWGVEEHLPSGASLVTVQDGGVLDVGNRRLKWGPFQDSVPRVLRYQIQTAPTLHGSLALVGQAAFDGRLQPVSGVTSVSPPEPVLERRLPDSYAPGSSLTVEVQAVPSPVNQAYAIEESSPVPPTLGTITHQGRWDPVTERIKWGPFQDSLPRTLRYEVLPAHDARGVLIWTGLGAFDGRPVTVAGETSLDQEAPRISRSAAATAVVGRPLVVRIDATPAPQVSSFAVEETPPQGWSPSQFSHGGRWDPATGKIKWGPFDDDAPRQLTYTVTPVATEAALGRFDGDGGFDGETVRISGIEQLAVVQGTVVRELPESYVEGTPITVTLTATPTPSEKAFVVEERAPAGWTVSGLNQGGVLDARTGKLKWGPFQDSTPRVLQYSATPPARSQGLQLFTGSGAFDGEVLDIGGDQITELRANRAPLVFPIQADRPPDRSIKIAIAKLVARALDPDGDVLRLVDAGPRSDEGAVVFAGGAYVVYVPPPGFNGPDRFWVILEDARGAREALSVHVQVLPPADVAPPNAAYLVALPDGSVRVVFLGIPEVTYLIQVSTDLSTWTTLGSRTADGVGFFEWIDTDAANHSGRFYRSFSP